jgi:hypothetical protein
MIANAPYWVAHWLRARLNNYPPDHPARPILERLANDDRMRTLWDPNEAGAWPWQAQLMLVQDACLYATDPMLADLLQAPEKRGFMTRPLDTLASQAKGLAEAIEGFPETAAELWAGNPITDGEGIDLRKIGIVREPERNEILELAGRLRAFAQRAANSSEGFRAALADLPPPSRRGRGDARQLAFRQALDRVLGRLVGVTLGREQRDRIIALLVSVVFRGAKIDADTIARTRQRQIRRRTE